MVFVTSPSRGVQAVQTALPRGKGTGESGVRWLLMPPGFISSGLKTSSDVRRRLHISANTRKILFCGWVWNWVSVKLLFLKKS